MVLGGFLAGMPARAGTLAEEHESLRERLEQAESRIASAKARRLDAPLARAEVDASIAQMALDTASLLMTMQEAPPRISLWLEKAKEHVLRSTLETMPSRTVEARGVFLDAGSLPKTPQGIHDLVERLAKAHFNMILPEVFRRGYTLYPSRYTERDPEFAQAPPDLLQTLLDEAHRYGMEVHPWVWTFRVHSPGFGNPVLSRFPALAARSEKTVDPRFLSPGDPRAREWVYNMLSELIDHYDIDGLMLDYIRYDEETPDDWSSRTYFSQDFQARYGSFPTFPLKPNSADWLDYQLWREEQVNQSVQTIAQRLKTKNPQLQLSAATFRGELYARLAKMQNWRHWSNNGWVDIVTSMLYTSRTDDLGRWIDGETDRGTRSNLLYPILGPHRMRDRMRETLEQVDYLNQKQQPGVLIFALAHLDPQIIEALADGPFRRTALPPHRNLILAVRRTLVELDNDYCATIQDASDWDLTASMAMFRAELKKLARSLPTQSAPYYQNAALTLRIQSLQALVRELVAARHVSGPVANEIDHRLGYALTLVQANAQRVGATRYVPTLLPRQFPTVDTREVRD